MTDNPQSSARRDFLRKGTALGIGLSAASSAISAAASQEAGQMQQGSGVLNEASKRLLERFGLKYPIFQAAPGGAKLAVAVANSGGMGAVGLTWDSADDAFNIVSTVRAATDGNYYANFVLNFEPEALDRTLEAGCPNIQFSFGVPDKQMVAKVRRAGAGLGIQVSSMLNAKMALEHLPDFLICQGIEAGGHVQATNALSSTLEEVLELAGEVPVLASGGIATGHDIRRVLNAGAAGAVLGTRFMATVESDAHEEYKRSLIAADSASTVYTICFNKDWNATHRVLRNSTFLNWEAQGCPVTGNKPGEQDIVATHPEYGPATRYETVPPLEGHEGALEQMAMYAGVGVGDVSDIPPAKALMERLWQEFENA